MPIAGLLPAHGGHTLSHGGDTVGSAEGFHGEQQKLCLGTRYLAKLDRPRRRPMPAGDPGVAEHVV
jgi:hypothetical protein